MKSLKTKTFSLIIISIMLFMVMSLAMSYIFFVQSAGSETITNLSDTRTQFFIICISCEAIISLLILLLVIKLVDYMFVHPISKIISAVTNVSYDGAENGNGGPVNNDELKNLVINTNDELEELCNSIKKMHASANDYIEGMKEREWDEEHDSMTLLYNRKKFDKRKKSVYPYVDKIYIACLDIINLSIVNTKLSVEAGDSIISKVGRELRRIESENIHSYRLEDDNFLVVMFGFKESEAIKMLEQWNERVGRLNRATDNFDCCVVWGGSYGENDINVDEIFKRADAEMYCQKMIIKKELGGIFN